MQINRASFIPQYASFLNIEAAAKVLATGGVVVYPTETFPAIGALATLPEAIDAIYAIKGRDPGSPLPLIAANLDQAGKYARLEYAPPALLSQFWPGPLSLLLPAKNYLAPMLINPQHKVCLRLSPRREAARLARLAGAPLAATSANLSGEAPAKDLAELNPRLLEALAASRRPWGILSERTEICSQEPSTLLEPLKTEGAWRLKIWREGAIKKEMLISKGWAII